MKKRKNSLEKSYPYLIVFLDDLREIEEIIKAQQPNDYCVKTKEYEYESVEELSKHMGQRKIRNIEIATHIPYVFIRIDHNGNSLYTSADNEKEISTFYNVNNILIKCQPKMAWFYNPIAFLFMGISIAVLSRKIPKDYTFFFYGFAMFNFYYAFKYLHSLFYGPSKIILVEKHKQENFFLRKKDDLLLILVTAILSILGTLFMQKYLLR